MDLSAIQEQREKFAKNAAPFVEVFKDANNSVGGIILQSGEYLPIKNWVCHGWLKANDFENILKRYRKESVDVKYILSAVMSPYSTPERLKEYLSWLITESPWERVFLDKNVNRVIELGHVVDANQPVNLIGNAMVASRFLTESYDKTLSYRYQTYEELLKIGCTIKEAFLFTHFFRNFDKKVTYPITFSRFVSGHSTFNTGEVGKEYFRNFLEGRATNLSKPLNVKGGYDYDTLSKVWGKEVEGDLFFYKLASLRPKTFKMAKDLHIFRPVAIDTYQYINEEGFKSVVEQLKEMLYA